MRWGEGGDVEEAKAMTPHMRPSLNDSAVFMQVRDAVNKREYFMTSALLKQ